MAAGIGVLAAGIGVLAVGIGVFVADAVTLRAEAAGLRFGWPSLGVVERARDWGPPRGKSTDGDRVSSVIDFDPRNRKHSRSDTAMWYR